MSTGARAALEQAWAAAGGDAELTAGVTFGGPEHALSSCFPVTAVAAGAIAAAALAAAGPPVHVDTQHAVIACRSERYLSSPGPDGLRGIDAAGGELPTADGWIRIHALYAHHRAAALSVLGKPRDRGEFAAAVAGWRAVDLESAVVEAGGAAAALRSRDTWRAHPHGSRVRDEPLVAVRQAADGGRRPRAVEGLRVVDLTRVIAGPTATKFLAACGATVVRVEDPRFEELPLLAADTGFGKRAVQLDLRDRDDRAAFETLVAGADVVVHGLRPGALAGLGYDEDRLRALAPPGVVVATLSAWGAAGPWAGRRGFDSLVQMASGIADEGRLAFASDRPVPLPLQLLDHATAYLLALGVLQALRRSAIDGGGWRVAVSLARTAAWLDDLGRVDAVDVADPDPTPYLRTMASPWGPLTHVRPCGAARYRSAPERPARAAAVWSS